MRFELRLGHSVLGFSDLEHRDPGMGAAFGRFRPTDGYEQVAPLFRQIAAREPTARSAQEPASGDAELRALFAARDALGLTLHGPSGQVPTQCLFVRDYSADAGPDAIELEAVLDGPITDD